MGCEDCKTGCKAMESYNRYYGNYSTNPTPGVEAALRNLKDALRGGSRSQCEKRDELLEKLGHPVLKTGSSAK